MKSLVSLSLLLAANAAPAAAQEPPPGDGPRGSSEVRPGEVRYDAVGYAVLGETTGVSAASDALPVGTHVEVTALDTGRTIVVAILGGGVGARGVIAVSSGAAATLGMSGDRLAVRVRKVTPTPQDVVLLREGQAASARADAPPALLVALRKKLPVATASTAPPRVAAARPPARPAARPTAQAVKPTKPAIPVTPTSSGYVVQIAALSSAARAAQVARAVGGTVIPGPPTWRVRIGPYPDVASATRARTEAARKGFAGGQITRIP